MRQVKVVVSDFHVGTGRYRADGSRNELEDFYFDEKFVEFLEYHRTGEFADAEVEVIINGDFLNLLQQSEGVADGDLFTERACVDLMTRVLEGHPELFDALAVFCAEPRRSLSIVVGNHDPGLLFDGVQQLLAERLGGQVRFFTDHYDFDDVHIEHGNQFDTLNAFPKKRFLTRGLPEPVVNLPWGSHYLIQVMSREKRLRPHIDKVVPHGRFFRWSLVHDTRWALKVILHSITFFLGSVFLHVPQRKFNLKTLLPRLWRYKPSPTLAREARGLLERGGYRVVILGHTHIALYREYPEGRVYVNTGTWNHVTSLDVGTLGRLVRLTYAYLERDPETGRWQPHLREWRGYHRMVEELYR